MGMALSIVLAVVFRLGIARTDSGAVCLELSFVGLVIGLVNHPPPGMNCELIRYANSLGLQTHSHPDVVQPMNNSLFASSIEVHPHSRCHSRSQGHCPESQTDYL